jgi:hypothetical protein
LAPASVFWGLGLEIWNFSGAWGLVLGVSLSGGSQTGKDLAPGFCVPDVAGGCPPQEQAFVPLFCSLCVLCVLCGLIAEEFFVRPEAQEARPTDFSLAF